MKKVELTDEKLTAKLTADGQHCPACGSDDLGQDGAPDGDHVLSVPIKCDACGATWFEHYRFASATDFKLG
jgi:hypothetical protein